MATAGGRDNGAGLPAWKLRLMQQQQQPPRGVVSVPSGNPASMSSSSAFSIDETIPKNSTASSCSSTNPADARAKLKKKMEAATLDPNLPPAFKVAMNGRLAFARQQQRRKNNDTWVSLNSSHINAESSRPPVDGGDDDDDSSFASMGEDSYYEQESHDDDAIIEENEEDEEDD
jgi:hypothetical protein